MRTWIGMGIVAALLAAVLAWSGIALAQSKPADQPAASPSGKVDAPKKIDGQVIDIDRNSGMVTVKAADGQTHQFRGSAETLKDLKIGDRLELTLRQPPR